MSEEKLDDLIAYIAPQQKKNIKWDFISSKPM